MELTVCRDYDEMSQKAAELIAEQIKKKPNSKLGLATGSTPIGTYQRLTELYQRGEISFKQAVTYNLDEYYPISADNEQSYHSFMKRYFFDRIDIDEKNTHIPAGETDDPLRECMSYEREIRDLGGMDIQLLGIGRNGHIGFNEPSDELVTTTHMTALTKDTIEANARFFDREDMVPTHALTMGMSTIMTAKKIILLAAGRSKLEAIRTLLSDNITTSVPATFLKLHPDVTVICDYDAYSDTRLGVDIGGMSVKMGLVENNCITHRRSFTIKPDDTADSIAAGICEACEELGRYGHIHTVGIGVPGVIRGGRVYSSNLPFDGYELGAVISKRLHMEVKLQNDANCAALGEQVAGAGMSCDNILLVTLGTGIGAGIIIGGKIYSGNGIAGEVGHMCIEMGGKECPCGEKGCWERYASVSALMEQVRDAAKKNPESILAQCAAHGVTGETVFDAMEKGCPIAEGVYGEYLGYLAAGLKNLINILDPKAVLIAGGLSNAGDKLILPLREKLGEVCGIKAAALRNDAGIIGAAWL